VDAVGFGVGVGAGVVGPDVGAGVAGPDVGVAVADADVAVADADGLGVCVVPGLDAGVDGVTVGWAVGDWAAVAVAVGLASDAVGVGPSEVAAVDVGLAVGQPLPGSGYCPQPAAIPVMSRRAEALIAVRVSFRS